ncbi:hypothetical protein ACRS3X_17045 [Ectopseudomonas hydrolytica]
MAQKFGTLIGGLWELVAGLVVSGGAVDAGKLSRPAMTVASTTA